MDLFTLVAKLGLDSSEYEEGLNGASEKAFKIGQGIGTGLNKAAKVGVAAVTAIGTAATATTGALVKGASDVAAYGDNIDKMSQKMGLSAEAYQEWDAIMQHSGTSIDSMKRGMTTLSRQAETNSEVFKQLGISQEELASMNQEELFAKTIAGLQSMEAGTERTVLAQQLLGGSARELGALLNTSAEDTEAMRQRVHELGGVMSDEAVKASAQFQDNLQDMQTAMAGVKRKITSQLLPGLNTLTAGFTSLIAGEDGATEAISEGFGQLVDGFSGIVEKISESAQTILPVVVDAIVTNLPVLLDSATQIIGTLGEGLLQALPSIIDAASQIMTTIVQGVTESIPQLIPAIVDVIMSIGNMLVENLPMLIDAAAQIILSLAQGIAGALPELVPAIIEVVLNIVDTLISNVDMLVDASIALIMGLADGLINALPVLIEKLPQIVVSIVEGLIRNAPKLLTAAVELIGKLVSGLLEGIPKLIESGVKLIGEFAGALLGGIGEVASAVGEIVGTIVDAFIGLPGQAVKWGADLIGGFLDGLWGAAGALWDGVCGIADGIVDFLGFSEPDKGPLSNFHTFAPDMMKLFAQGIKDNEHIITDQIAKSFDFDDVIIGAAPNVQTKAATQAMGTGESSPIPVNVNVVLEGDAQGIFHMVRTENEIYRKANCRSAFA